MVVMFVDCCVGVYGTFCTIPTIPTVENLFGREFFFPARTLIVVFLLTGIRLWAHKCAHLNFELRDCLITFPIFVLSQRLIARNVREFFSFNRGVSHLNEAHCIDDVSRGSLSCYKILANN
jgi:hypothetical protein